MNNIKKIRVSGVDYSVYDEQAHDEINSIDASVPAGLTENSEEKKIYLVNKNGENIGEGVSLLVGADGKSAYEAAVEGGYEGTEAEFAESLANIASLGIYNGETEDIEPPVEEALLGTWTLNPEFVVDESINSLEGVINGILFGRTEAQVVEVSYTKIQFLGAGVKLYKDDSNWSVLSNGYQLRWAYNGDVDTSTGLVLWMKVATFSIESVSTTDTSTLEAVLTWLQANATKQ